MPQILVYIEFDDELKRFIPSSFENWDPCIRTKYRTIFEQYQRAQTYFFKFPMQNLLITSFQLSSIIPILHSELSTMGDMLRE